MLCLHFSIFTDHNNKQFTYFSCICTSPADTELVNGAVYALPNPSTSMNNGQIQVDPKKLSDIGCYATTYMSNDQLHIYQELTEVNPHKMDLQSSLQVTTPGYPAHPPITPNPSTSTLQKCSPYTLPHSQLNLERIASSSRQQLSNPSDTLVSLYMVRIDH